MTFADVRAVMWKEWKGFIEQIGGESRVVPVVVLFFFVGLSTFSAYLMGPVWVGSPVSLITYPLLAASIGIQPIADSFAGERERHTLETLLASRLSDTGILVGKILAALVPAVGFGLLLFGLGILTVNVFHGQERWLLPPRWLFVGTCLLVTTLAGLVACGGVFVSLGASSVRQAVQTFGLVMIGTLLVPIVVAVLLPDPARDRVAVWLRSTAALNLVVLVAGALLAVDVGFLLAAFRRFRRHRAILV